MVIKLSDGTSVIISLKANTRLVYFVAANKVLPIKYGIELNINKLNRINNILLGK